MHKQLVRKLNSSFLSCEKDTETILKKIFIEDREHANELKRLLMINTKDCMDKNNEDYERIVTNTSLADLIREGYIRLTPKLGLPEHEEVKSYIILSFDNFTPNVSNTEHRDCVIHFDVVCHTDYWSIGDYALRPLKICGYLDGMINRARLSGIGWTNFLNCSELILDENLSGYSLIYEAVHGSDDRIPGGDN
jgi:hypothetical protein